MKCINDSENDTQFSMEMITFDNYQETFNLYEENFNNQDYIQQGQRHLRLDLPIVKLKYYK